MKKINHDNGVLAPQEVSARDLTHATKFLLFSIITEYKVSRENLKKDRSKEENNII